MRTVGLIIKPTTEKEAPAPKKAEASETVKKVEEKKEEKKSAGRKPKDSFDL